MKICYRNHVFSNHFMYFCWKDGIRKSTERAKIESKLGRLIRPSVQPKISDYGYKVNALIEKCLLYSAIQKSGRSDFGTQRYENFFEKVQNGDGI